MSLLTSPQNPFVKKLGRLLRDGGYRAEQKYVVLEGEKAVLDAISRGHRCLNLVLSEDRRDGASVLARSANGRQRATPVDAAFVHSAFPSAQTITHLAPEIFKKTSLMKQSTGVMGIFSLPEWNPALWQQAKRHVAVLDAVQSPQNVGAIVRNAAAFGVEALLLLPGSADPSHPEVLRASSGYALDVPLFRCSPEAVTAVADRFSVLILSADGELCVGKDNLPTPCLWVLGNEGCGPTWHVSHALWARIPMMPGVESLNVGVASGICFYAGFSA